MCDNETMPSRAHTKKRPRDTNQLAYQIVRETLEGPSWEPKRCSGGARRSGSRIPETPRRPGGSCEAVCFHASRRSKE